MKILTVIEINPHLFLNPYIYTLIDGINSQFNDVEWGYGLNVFWSQDCYDYDIVHIHWPDVLGKYNHRRISLERLTRRFQNLKERGIKIVTTCHNLVPHYSNDKRRKQLYTLVYDISDCIIHLGSYSLNLFKQKYPSKQNLLLPHHVYDTVYTNKPSREESIKVLNLNHDMIYILCFGLFRANEERKLVIKIARKYGARNIKILAPSFCIIPQRRNFFIVLGKKVLYIYLKMRYSKYVIFEKRPISDEQLLYYYGASDFSLIHRLHILNSGNVTLGFLMEKVVVGPDVGNVGETLRKTNNPTFASSNIQKTLFPAIDKALELKATDKGEMNYQYAIKNLNTKDSAKKLYYYYKQVSNS